MRLISEHASSFSSGYDSPANDVGFKIPTRRISIVRALHRCFWVPFYSVGILKFVADCSGFAGPMLLNKLVGFIEDKNENVEFGYGYAAGLCITTLIGNVL